MQMSLDNPSDGYKFKSYQDATAQIDEQYYQHSLIVSAEKLIENWPPKSLQELTLQHFDEIFLLKPEVILLGTGEKHQFPNQKLISSIVQCQVGFEAMSNVAACRTYNVLLAEGRQVVCALLIDATSN